MVFRFLALLGALTLCGCGNLGGGGSVHLPPDSVALGKEIRLHLELTSTGMRSGRLDRRYTKLSCHYYTDDKSAAGTVKGMPKNATDIRMDVEFTIPALQNAESKTLTYWFTFDFDSVPNQRSGGVVPIE